MLLVTFLKHLQFARLIYPAALIASWACATLGMAQDSASSKAPNYDEAKIPAYQLPALIDEATAGAKDFSAAWSERRAELLQIFAEQMYGTSPTASYAAEYEQLESGP
ncbi:MAG: hypothetical protein ABI557_18970, partial [Aureliella sp.]